MTSRGGSRTNVVVAAILAISFLAATAVLLAGQHQSQLAAARDTRAAAADAVAPIVEELRTAMDSAAAGAGTRALTGAGAASAGIDDATATRARDLGMPVLDDSGEGLVVVATYDTASLPATVEERREHLRGLSVAPLHLAPILRRLQPAEGGISLAGPDRRVLSLPGSPPSSDAAYSVDLGPGPTTAWSVTLWLPPPTTPVGAWAIAAALVLGGTATAGAIRRREIRAARSREEVRRAQAASATVAAMATVAQQSLDLAEVLPAAAAQLSDSFGLKGLSLGAPSGHGERRLFVWGETPGQGPVAHGLPAKVAAGETLGLALSRGGRIVGLLRVLAGRHLDSVDVRTVASAGEVLCSALANAEAFAQQRELVTRMRSVDELKTVFLATASHELRTPVGAITGFSGLLMSDWDDLSPEERRHYAERVDVNARHLDSLVEALLDFSRLERGNGSASPDVVLDLGEAVCRVLDEQPQVTEHHEVSLKAPRGLCVSGSAQAVERVVSNLVGNAAKYSTAGSTIYVQVRQHHQCAEVIVDDEGPGVPEAERERIFSRFFRGEGDAVVRTRGAGLGLAIVQEFAASMGGMVSVASAPTGGARFTVSYPLAPVTQAAPEGETDVDA